MPNTTFFPIYQLGKFIKENKVFKINNVKEMLLEGIKKKQR
jgi:hypothetical protein